MKTIKSVLKSIGRAPVKSVLTFVTVGFGVGILIVSIGMSSSFRDLIEGQLDQQGIVVSYANAEYSSDGVLDTLRPPQSDAYILDYIGSEVAGVEAISPIAPVEWSEFVVDSGLYRVRSVIGVNEQYADVMGLETIAGRLFTEEDVANGARSAVVSEGLATMLFGSAQSAIGQTIRPPESDEGAGRRKFSQPIYTVIGVVEDATDLQRRTYGVADMIVPYTSTFPAGFNSQQAESFFLAQGVLRVTEASFATVEAQLREVLSRNYGGDFLVETWEGGPNGDSWFIEETRATISTFSTVVNLLGVILLAVASIGILSIMLLEVLGRSREIALERALGASKFGIIKEFATRSVIVSSISAAVGVALALLLSGPLTALILPIFAGVDLAEIGGVISVGSVLVGSIAAIAIGGVFGTFPVFSVLKPGIADSIRSE